MQGSLHILEETESSNNYATAGIHAGMAKHGDGWLALHQTAGKGQRGKQWQSPPAENILLSVAINPGKAFSAKPFLYSALVALACKDFFEELAGSEIKIKWPNDIYWCDRKAAGILIENIYRGAEWQWAVTGVGMNINQIVFDDSLANAVSLKGITGKQYDVIMLAAQLHEFLLARIAANTAEPHYILEAYNASLYKGGELVRFKKGSMTFSAELSHVDQYGLLHTAGSLPQSFTVGEVQWLM